jgi:hypothetical protein
MELTPQEIRVLGCLVEKERTTPQQYPMTENALITACNQTTNRDPIVAYEQSTVRRALLNLRQQGLARMVHRPGDRSEKHRHLLAEALSLSPAEIAVLSVLLLRGPQTVGELRTRTERMQPFASLTEVQAVLDGLANREGEPLVAQAPRESGQSQVRYRHLLGGPDEEDPHAVAAAPAETRSRANPIVEQLQAEVAQLRERVQRLEQELGVGEPAAPAG